MGSPSGIHRPVRSKSDFRSCAHVISEKPSALGEWWYLLAPKSWLGFSDGLLSFWVSTYFEVLRLICHVSFREGMHSFFSMPRHPSTSAAWVCSLSASRWRQVLPPNETDGPRTSLVRTHFPLTTWLFQRKPYKPGKYSVRWRMHLEIFLQHESKIHCQKNTIRLKILPELPASSSPSTCPTFTGSATEDAAADAGSAAASTALAMSFSIFSNSCLTEIGWSISQASPKPQMKGMP